jgi:opacity protein-like surface antigen
VPLWTGYYFGVHGGGGWGTATIDDPIFGPSLGSEEIPSNGILVGGQIGHNWQFGNAVIGGELDGSWASWRGNVTRMPSDIIAAQGAGSHIQALATATVRLGYAMGPWLAYAKAGAAFAKIELNAGRLTADPDPTTYDENWFGVAGGAGFEVAFFRNVSAKIEYNALYFPEKSLVFADHNTTSQIDQLIHVVKAGINVRFGGDLVAARY